MSDFAPATRHTGGRVPNQPFLNFLFAEWRRKAQRREEKTERKDPTIGRVGEDKKDP